MTGSATTLSEDGEAWQCPSGRLGTMRRAEVVALAVLCAAAVVAVTIVKVLAGAPLPPLAVAAPLAAIALGGLVGDRFLQRRVAAWGYSEREDDLLVRRGVLFSRLSVVPYGRMQFIDVVAGPVERYFRLATVRMHTAAAASDARIPGLSREEAARLRDRLAELGEAKAAGL
ncbi:MAG: PH domain-containing protein [Candidatus Dormibacterales bacterium]